MEYQFEAEIKASEIGSGSYVEIPFDVEKEFDAKRVKVKATFDGIEYRGSIVKMGTNCHILGLLKTIRMTLGKEVGDTVTVTIMKDETEREVELPEDLRVELIQSQKALEFYESLSYSMKRKYIQWITSAKKQETRNKRVTEAVKRLEAHEKW